MAHCCSSSNTAHDREVFTQNSSNISHPLSRPRRNIFQMTIFCLDAFVPLKYKCVQGQVAAATRGPACRIITVFTDSTKHYRCWNVFDKLCRMGHRSFWSWFDVNRSTFEEDMREKRLLYFHSQWPWPLTFSPHIFSPNYSTVVQRWVSIKL